MTLNMRMTQCYTYTTLWALLFPVGSGHVTVYIHEFYKLLQIAAGRLIRCFYMK